MALPVLQHSKLFKKLEQECKDEENEVKMNCFKLIAIVKSYFASSAHIQLVDTIDLVLLSNIANIFECGHHEAKSPEHLRSLVGEFCLEWALFCKQSNFRINYIVANCYRFVFNPSLHKVDVVRLLGAPPNMTSFQWLCEEEQYATDAIPSYGVFEIVESNRNDFRPSSQAMDWGSSLRDIFRKHEYSPENAEKYLLPFVPFGHSGNFCAESYFNHRLDVAESRLFARDALDVLMFTFLFGLAGACEEMERFLGKSALKLLLDAKLLRSSPMGHNFLVAEYQIYPVKGPSKTTELLFFLTDWPMQSCRPEKFAVMSLGHDSLELMAATSVGLQGLSILDMCCGCGAQGIFAALAGSCKTSICSDLNLRACRVAAANAAMNGVLASITNGDLFESLDSTIRFSWILCNPPFVALPSDRGALFANAGNFGTDILSRFLPIAISRLEDNGSVLLVTELPNIEDSGIMLSSIVPSPSTASVDVVYVADDVEDIQEYGELRATETDQNLVEVGEWMRLQAMAGVKNRALAVVRVQNNMDGVSLHRYSDESTAFFNKTIENPVDEIDALLTSGGSHFLRSCLFSSET